MILLRLILGLTVFLRLHAVAAAQPTVRLEGRLIHVEGRETGNVDLSFGPYGTTVTRSDGFFTHVLPGDVEEVTVEISGNRWTVLYPRDGRIAVPRGEGVVIDVVAGEPIDQVITRTLAEKHNRLLSELTNLGAEQDQIRVILEGFVDEVRRRMELDEQAFREAVDLAAERNRHYPEIAAALNNYVLEARDLKDAFRLLADIAISDPTVIESLDSTILVYNEAYEEINNRRPGFEQAIAAYWHDERLAADFRSLMDYALGEIHASLMLRLNDSLVGIHRLQELRRSRRRERARELSEDIRRIVADLEPRLDELDRRTERILQALFTE